MRLGEPVQGRVPRAARAVSERREAGGLGHARLRGMNRAGMTTARLPPARQQFGPCRARALREPPRPQPDAGPDSFRCDSG